MSYGGTVVNNITLATMTNEIHVDALIDTGASLCIVPPNVSRALGFEPRNRLRQRRVLVVGGEAKIDVHRLEYMKVGSARAHNVLFGVYSTFSELRITLVGMTFMQKFTNVTFDLAGKRVVFRGKS